MRVLDEDDHHQECYLDFGVGVGHVVTAGLQGQRGNQCSVQNATVRIGIENKFQNDKNLNEKLRR